MSKIKKLVENIIVNLVKSDFKKLSWLEAKIFVKNVIPPCPSLNNLINCGEGIIWTKRLKNIIFPNTIL